MIQAMILAAGEGRRMRPLTLNTPKPLLPVAGKPLIEHQLARLAAAGIEHCVINVAYLGDQIRHALGDGSRHGLRITYSVESQPLETGGALYRVLPLLNETPFLLINADIWLEYPLHDLLAQAAAIEDGHLVLVENPDHNRSGDFTLDESGRVSLVREGGRELVEKNDISASYTFSGLSVLHPKIVRDYPRRRDVFPLLEALAFSSARGGLTGEVYRGLWMDIGTPQRLQELEFYLQCN